MKNTMLNILLLTALSFLYSYFLGYDLYLLFISMIANLAIILRIMDLINKSKLIMYSELILVFISGMLSFFIINMNIIPEKVLKKHRKKMIFLFTLIFCVTSWLVFNAHPILAIFNLFLISFNIFCIKILKKSPQSSFSKP